MQALWSSSHLAHPFKSPAVHRPVAMDPNEAPSVPVSLEYLHCVQPHVGPVDVVQNMSCSLTLSFPIARCLRVDELLSVHQNSKSTLLTLVGKAIRSHLYLYHQRSAQRVLI